MICLKNVEKTYNGHITALSGINLQVDKGEFVFLVGPSGAGKSTLIKLLYREEVPTKGEVSVLGEDLGSMRRSRIPFFRRRIGVVFQDFKLLEDRTVYENVAFALRVTDCPSREIQKRVINALHIVNLRDRRDAYPQELSGGEQQRVAIARALVRKPEILLADEPTGNLDPSTSMEIFRLLERANLYGTTVVVATHARAFVDAMKKRVVELRDGRIVRDVRRGSYSE